jgi:hypothetical protein
MEGELRGVGTFCDWQNPASQRSCRHGLEFWGLVFLVLVLVLVLVCFCCSALTMLSFLVPAMASNTDLRAVGATYLQLKISLDKGNKTETQSIGWSTCSHSPARSRSLTAPSLTLPLSLTLSLSSGWNSNTILLTELTLPQFYEFLREMEAAKRNLDQFGSYVAKES